MSRRIDKTTIDLFVNGEQAQAALERLKVDADDLRNSIASATKAADKNRLERDLAKVEKEMNRLNSAAYGTGKILDNLSGTSMWGLKNALKHLRSEMSMVSPHSATWESLKKHVEEVEGQIKKLNNESRSMWSRFKDWADSAWPALDLLRGWMTSIVGSAKEMVDAFASMDQEMANVRKFTGMTAEQVAELNDELKKIDTRTSREDLNKLAQEAGRLGKTSKDDVLGFVRAADQINVALDDLGEGASLTLSKLTGIFGDEERYGTEQSLLKVGSVINELSQNCSASAPYLSNFAERMGGVGHQAGMTIQQIMGFGAVLDSNAQKVEASATALSQIIVRLYQDPAKYAKVAGLNVAEFSKLMREDANSAVILFLETLQKAGGMDVLSPMFKDMGENGSRAIQALSTLATNIDEVKAQQEAANKAFAEGTSVTKEFDVQNNTVQASLEKCKNRANELRVELGERLQPLLKHMLVTGSSLIKGLLEMIKYVEQNRATIIMLCIVIAGWTFAMKANALAQKTVDLEMKIASAVSTAYRMSIIALKAVFYLLTGQINKANASTKALNKTMKGSLWGVIATAIALVVAQLMDYINKTNEAAEEQKRLNEEQKEWEKGLRNIDKQSDEYSKKELARLKKLYSATTDDKKSKEERLKAVNDLRNQYPDYFSKLSTEQIMVGNAKSAYDALTTSIIKSAEARAASDKIAELGSQKMDEKISIKDNNDEKKKLVREYSKLKKELNAELNKIQSDVMPADGGSVTATQINVRADALRKKLKEVESKLRTVNADIKKAQDRYDKIDKTQKDLSQEYGVDINDAIAGDNNNPESANVPNTPYTSQVLAEKERKKSELERKRELAKAKAEFKQQMEKAKGDYEAESAKNVFDYGTGLKSYEDYINEKERLDMKYLDNRIELYKSLYKGESKNEKKLLLMHDEDYQEFLLKKAELSNKQQAAAAKRDIDEYTRQYNMEVKKKQFEFLSPYHALYGDAEAQEEELFQLRIDYLVKCRKKYDENSKEYAEYQRQIDTAEMEHMVDLRKKLMQKYEQWVDQYTTLSADKRFKIESGIVEKLYEQRKISEQEYQLWLAQLRAKHNAESAAATSAADKSKYSVSGPGGDVDIRSDSAQTKARVQSLNAQKNSAVDELKKRLQGGLISQEEFDEGVRRIDKAYEKNLFDPVRSMLDEQTRMLFDLGVAWADMFKSISKNGKLSFEDITNVAAATVATLCAGLQQYSQFLDAEKRIELKAIEDRYDREITLAQGNSYKVAKAEKKKEEETQKIKAEYAKKEFAIKVIMAVAQTAQNALLGYAAGLQAGFPMAMWLAPLLAGLASAQGLVQVALLKKQQQAAAAEGYSEGGFTRKGAVNEPAGVVHAGEWVASQKLLANPVARPMIDALDYAQRTNTIGSLRADDVSRSITANNSLVRIAENDGGSALMAAVASEMSRTVADLTDRLRKPFFTVNTVTGDRGIKAAQDEYSRLMKNKSPKSRR